MPVQAIPHAYHTLTPYLHVPSAAAAIEFYVEAFEAVETMRLTMPGGAIGHAEVKIGDSAIMMADENPQWGNKSPKTLGGATGGYMIYVDDVDAAFAKAIAAGATMLRPVMDQFYGDRSGTVTDPFGHNWTLATHIEDVPVSEMQSRMDAWMSG